MTDVCPIEGIRSLLLSTDGSEFSEGATREAIRLARMCSCKLYVLYVVETNPEFEAFAPEIVEKAEIQAREHLVSVKERAGGEGVECEAIVHHGEEPYRFIVDEASRIRVDLIVMGRRGRTGIRRLLMGSVTERTIGLSPMNVLIVPRDARIEFKSIVVATDASKYSKAVVDKAIRLTKITGARLHVVTVTRPDATPERIKESEDALKVIQMISRREGIKAVAKHLRNKPHGKIHEAILGYARKNKADLVIIGPHGRTGIKRLIMGSVAGRVIGHSACAVLVVKA